MSISHMAVSAYGTHRIKKKDNLISAQIPVSPIGHFMRHLVRLTKDYIAQLFERESFVRPPTSHF